MFLRFCIFVVVVKRPLRKKKAFIFAQKINAKEKQ